VFRLVTEHTIEEKIVERAQQKLKLDAMVVQSGRLKDRDNKLSRDELLSAVRFGADKIFKSKDSSITDDDIDMILDAGKKKTQELNEKLQAADKGDLLDFKFDGSSVQTFDGVDYSKSALNKARVDAEILGIFDIGKRERKEANYNEKSIYKQQMTTLQTTTTKKKTFKLPKDLRLPRMEEWQMFDREALFKIQDEEEAAFKNLPEEVQKLANTRMKENETSNEPESVMDTADAGTNDAFELPRLLSEEMQAEKDRLLSEGFSNWKRHEYTLFVKASSFYGRDAIDKIALEVGLPESVVVEFANAFWGEKGKSRIAEHEYERVSKLVEKGEKRIKEIGNLERATSVLVGHFDDPWVELEFTYVNCKDKMFTAEEDRHLLCWAHKVRFCHCNILSAPLSTTKILVMSAAYGTVWLWAMVRDQKCR
jgi:SWI/SNF-related matrix-associated actin-dependent regulator of chromatin subfamily A member 5